MWYICQGNGKLELCEQYVIGQFTIIPGPGIILEENKQLHASLQGFRKLGHWSHINMIYKGIIDVCET